MANASVNEFSTLINQQIKTQEKIEECLWKLEALLTIVISDHDFYKAPKRILHNYFSIVNDLVIEATESNRLSLKNLFAHTPTVFKQS